MKILENLKKATLELVLSTSGPIGTAVATVDFASSFNVKATVANLTFTIPTPTDLMAGDQININNPNVAGALPFTMFGLKIDLGRTLPLVWTGTEFTTETANINVGNGLALANGVLSLNAPFTDSFKSSPVATAQASTLVKHDDLWFRYSINGSTGNLDISSATATPVPTYWYGEERYDNLFANLSRTGDVLVNAPANGTYLTLLAGGAGLNEMVTYTVWTQTQAYRVTILNFQDTTIHFAVEKLSQKVLLQIGATLRTLNAPNLLTNPILQASFQTAYDSITGSNAPDIVPPEVVSAVASLNNGNWKIYLGHTQWFYTNTTNGTGWLLFGGGKSQFGATVPANHIFTFK
jgi:hypothetical protein